MKIRRTREKKIQICNLRSDCATEYELKFGNFTKKNCISAEGYGSGFGKNTLTESKPTEIIFEQLFS